MTTMRLHSCHNRPPLKETIIVQVGWSEWFEDGFGDKHRTPIYKEVPAPMTKDCQYTKQNKYDPCCGDCVWRADGQ